MPNVFVIRHGQTEHNRQGIIQGPRLDGPLSDEGLQQADALGRAFGATTLQTVFVSPLQRARQTGQAILDHANAAPSLQVVPELYELDFGDLCGRYLTDVQDVMQGLYDAWDMGFVDRAMPGGESPMIAQHRVRAFAKRLGQMEGDVGIVAHGRLNRILLSTVLGMPLTHMSHYPQDNAAISHLRMAQGATLLRLNDTTHLAS